MGRRVALFLLAVGVLVGCGKEAVKDSPVTGKASLVVFGAGYCEVCKDKFPQIASLVSALPADMQKRLSLKLFVTAGAPASVHPTDDLAEAYRKDHFPAAEAHADLPWRWTNFKALLPGQKLEVPAAVILDDKGKVVRTFTAGDTTFVPQEIVLAAKAQLGTSK